jgi:protein-arginine kinase activator protein McsA
MMNARAQASVFFRDQQYAQALESVEAGVERIREFFARFGEEKAFRRSNEVKVLRRFAREIRRKMPIDPLRRLQIRLDRAVKAEQYEIAARLRDEIEAMKLSRK